eukprot:gene920-biopygen761
MCDNSQFAAVKTAIEARIQRFTEMKNEGFITEIQLAAAKLDVTKEELAKYEASLTKKETPLAETKFDAEEIKRQPFLKDLLNQRDLWKRHNEAVEADPKAWEADVTSTFLAKATSGTLSPLLTLIGQYLLFTDHEMGRRYLLEILFKQPASTRLSIHNWHILSTAPAGTDITNGPKVQHLTVPLFPWTDHVLREQNAKILDSVDEIAGGSAPKGKKEQGGFFVKDEDVLPGCTGGGWKPVLDGQTGSLQVRS